MTKGTISGVNLCVFPFTPPYGSTDYKFHTLSGNLVGSGNYSGTIRTTYQYRQQAQSNPGDTSNHYVETRLIIMLHHLHHRPLSLNANTTNAVCPPGSDMCDDPHMQGLRGQTIDWSGVDGGWYCLITDDNANIHVNVRLTAPLPEEFPNRQLITGLSILSEGSSLVIEVKDCLLYTSPSPRD